MAKASSGVGSSIRVAARLPKDFRGAVTGSGCKGHKWVMRLAGLILLCAAGLKAHQIATQPVTAPGWLGSRTSSLALVEFELALGSLLLFGAWARITWAVAFTTFAGFAGISLAMLARRASSCGCFGAISVQPLYVHVLDVAVLILLVWARPDAQSERPPTYRRSRLALSAFLVVFTLGSAVPLLGLTQPVMGADGLVIMQGRVIFLDPTRWLNKALPLMQYVEGSDALGEGTWTVILHRAGCPACRDLLDKRRLTDVASAESRDRLALIEVPGGSSSVGDRIPAGRRMRLDPSYEWEAPLPIEMRLVQGVVHPMSR